MQGYKSTRSRTKVEYIPVVLATRIQLAFSSRHDNTEPLHTQEHTCVRKLVTVTTQPTTQHEVDGICCCGADDDVSRDDPGTQRDEPGRRHSAEFKG